MPITVGSMPSDGRTFVTPSLGVAILIHNWRLLVPGRSFPLLSGGVCCRAASDTLDSSAGPFGGEPMPRRNGTAIASGKGATTRDEALGSHATGATRHARAVWPAGSCAAN